MKTLLLTIWQLPQIILGILVYVLAIWVDGATENPADNCLYVRWTYKLNISLCRYIFVNRDASKELKKYMRKYLLLSKIFGWFYLPIMGLRTLIILIINLDFSINLLRINLFGNYKIYGFKILEIETENYTYSLLGVTLFVYDELIIDILFKKIIIRFN